jgi:hypothetical protein
MIPTAEVRWFFFGSLPAVAHRWFLADNDRPTSPTRTDHYLIFPGCETAGVKRRGKEGEQKAKFEVKVLRGAPETVRYPSGVAGRSDCWVKWSYGEPPVEAWAQALSAESEGWIAVEKRRWLRTFSLDGGALEEVDPEKTPVEGCNVELTTITALGQPWWSLGLEAFDWRVNPFKDPWWSRWVEGLWEPRVRENLRRVGAHFFSEHPPPDVFTFDTINSLAYPAWLNSLG